MRLADIERLRENDHFEAKAARGGLPESIWETYSAFANTLGGVIALGVAEDLSDHSLHPVGLEDPQAIVDAFWKGICTPFKVSDNILASGNVGIEDAEGRKIVLIRVPRARPFDKPVFIDGNVLRGTYWRSGEADLRASREQIEAMLSTSGKRARTVGELQARIDAARSEPDFRTYPSTDR